MPKNLLVPLLQGPDWAGSVGPGCGALTGAAEEASPVSSQRRLTTETVVAGRITIPPVLPYPLMPTAWLLPLRRGPSFMAPFL